MVQSHARPDMIAVGRDVLDGLHHLGQLFAVGFLARREGHAAVAEHDRRDAVPARRRADRVPRQLGVEVGVDVDEARRDDAALGVDLAPCSVLDHADLGDPVTVHGQVADGARGAGSVDDESVPNQEVVCHQSSVSRLRGK